MVRVRNIKSIGNVKPIQAIHFIPPKFNPIYKIELVSSTETIDVTKSLVDGDFTEGVTGTIGSFNFKILDPSNNYSDKINEYDLVNLYIDYGTAATTLRFSGKIERKVNTEHIYLELTGRSLAMITTGVNVIYDSGGLKARSIILKEIIDKYFSGVISTSGIEDDLTEVEKVYSEVPFWDIVEELCNSGKYDAYISTSLIMNYFVRGSRENKTEAIVENRNLIQTIEFAKDTEELVTKVRVYGKSVEGIPVLATSSSNTNLTGGIDKVLKIDNTNITNVTQAKEFADQKYAANNFLPTIGSIKSLMLPTLLPGEKLRIVSPTNNIPPLYYEIYSYTHTFSSSGSPITTVNIKKPRLNLPGILKKNIKFKTDITASDNPYSLDSSYIFDFKSDTGTHSGTAIKINSSTGKGELYSPGGFGTWTSPIVTTSLRLSAIYPKLSGTDLKSVLLRVSSDGGNIYTPMVAGIKSLPSGKNTRFQIIINSTTTNITAAGFLYSTYDI
ncbi:MAG TPA: hypothetical protein ENI61_06360 [Ignavibacteria bacterium]|nr:hypothetical protein [Ignavibacteria bacterium]